MSWELKKLSEVCEIQPKKAEVKDTLNDSDSVSFMGMDKLGIDTMHAISDETKELSAVYKSYTYFQENDVLLAKITPCFENGKLGIAKKLANGVGFGSSEFTVYRCSGELINEYLYYFLKSELFRQEGIKSMSGAVGHKRVTKEYLTDALIPLPPLPVQKQIVEKLDAAFADIDKAISATEKNIENTEALFQDFLNRIYENNNWRQISLGEYYDVRDGTHDSPKYVENGFPLITSKNLKNGRLDFKKINLISEKDFREINKRSKVDPNDVLMAMIGTIGNPVVIDNDVNFAIKNVALFKTDSEQSGDFLAYYLRTSNVKNKMSSDSKGTTQKFVGLGYLRNFSITIPDNYEKQLEVVKEIKKFEVLYESLKRNYLTKSKSLEALKTSILKQAFSGELTKDVA